MKRRIAILGAASFLLPSSQLSAQPTLALNFDSLMGRAVQIGPSLPTPLARAGLIAFVDAMREARVATKARGDEGEAFSSTMAQVKSVLLRIVPEPLPAPLPAPADVVKLNSERFEKNRDSLPTFLATIRKLDNNLLQRLPDSEIVVSQLVVSLIIGGVNRSIWEQGFKFTAFYPFC